jgi:protocatechuate 3,4-dioxygenase beta subunit
MIHPTRYLVIVALVFCHSASFSRAAAQVVQKKKSLTGTISGRVTIHGKGRAGIMLSLSDAASLQGQLAKATTNDNGDYRLIGIAPGHWVVTPIAPAFVVVDYSFESIGKTVVVAAGESVDGIDFALARGGVITGKVTDADGRPLIEERLTLIPADRGPGLLPKNPYDPRTLLTDDRGVYRIFGLAAGRYKIAVGQPQKSGMVATARRAYQQTFHPDTTEPAKATIVEVAEGGEAAHIDITVGRALQSFSASGQIVDGETGEPVPGRRWGLARMTDNRDTNFYPAAYPSNNKGEFKIEGLLPGRYAVFVQPDQDVPAYSESVQFEVLDRDIDGLVIKTLPGATLSGRVVIEGIQDKAFFARLSQMRLNIYVYSPATAFPNWHSAAINPDGSFHIGGLQPGTASINTVSSRDPSLVKNFSNPSYRAIRNRTAPRDRDES